MLLEYQYNLVGIASKSDALHGEDRTRQRILLLVTQVGFCKSLLVALGIKIFAWVWGEGGTNDGGFIYEKELNVFGKASTEEWSGKCLLGQRWKIFSNAFHHDPWSPEFSAIILEWWADFALDICLLQKCVWLVLSDLFIAVEFLCQTHSIYLWCLLEANMLGVIHGFGEICLVTSGAWRFMKERRTLSYCLASLDALVWDI